LNSVLRIKVFFSKSTSELKINHIRDRERDAEIDVEIQKISDPEDGQKIKFKIKNRKRGRSGFKKLKKNIFTVEDRFDAIILIISDDINKSNVEKTRFQFLYKFLTFNVPVTRDNK
jgi:hypothetical protein